MRSRPVLQEEALEGLFAYFPGGSPAFGVVILPGDRVRIFLRRAVDPGIVTFPGLKGSHRRGGTSMESGKTILPVVPFYRYGP
jgi:hypothetical protein